MLENAGFKVVVPKEIFSHKRYLAGEDHYRADIINKLYSDPDIDCIMCARGGFGAMRILPFLDWEVLKKNPKPFVGFSDNSALLTALIADAGHVVIHGPTVVSLAQAQSRTIDSLIAALQGLAGAMIPEKPGPLRGGHAQGILMGGNLSTLSHLLGTPYQPSFHNAILFIEDVNEKAYQIDRMLTQMKMAGLFSGLRGVVVGDFYKTDNEGYIQEILLEIFDDPEIPILEGMESGHGPVNLSMRMGAPVRLDAGNLTLEWLGG